jgi:hypothetical protein
MVFITAYFSAASDLICYSGTGLGPACSCELGAIAASLKAYGVCILWWFNSTFSLFSQ